VLAIDQLRRLLRDVGRGHLAFEQVKLEAKSWQTTFRQRFHQIVAHGAQAPRDLKFSGDEALSRNSILFRRTWRWPALQTRKVLADHQVRVTGFRNDGRPVN
jgi:hypothetical protein